MQSSAPARNGANISVSTHTGACLGRINMCSCHSSCSQDSCKEGSKVRVQESARRTIRDTSCVAENCSKRLRFIASTHIHTHTASSLLSELPGLHVWPVLDLILFRLFSQLQKGLIGLGRLVSFPCLWLTATVFCFLYLVTR